MVRVLTQDRKYGRDCRLISSLPVVIPALLSPRAWDMVSRWGLRCSVGASSGAQVDGSGRWIQAAPLPLPGCPRALILGPFHLP
jgi:hypothetical protein